MLFDSKNGAASTFAVFSDVHSNLEALQAVLADIAAQGIRHMVCLGDIVGYAASPAQCLKRVRELGCPVVMGNHDAAAATDDDLYAMRDVAAAGIHFSRRKLTAAQRAWLAGLPLIITDEHHEFVHASLHAPAAWPYILREWEAMEHFAAQRRRLAFCGHTHMPNMLHHDSTGNLKFLRGRGRLPVAPGGKTLVNVGSVGQPRDGCPAACYVVCDAKADTIEFRRVEYDIAKARRKIMRAKLPAFVAERLSAGQ
jgi:diadenosine tetraphosphatase ApaH/serine/threonine PP2A family protein phosphatase